MVDSLLDWLASVGTSVHHPAVLALFFASAAVEYVLPPAPGDAVTLGGAVLIAAYGWSLPLVYLLFVAGSVSGSMVAFAIGRAWRRRRHKEGRLEELVARFEKHPNLYLLGHRFIPGMRPLFLMAAGLSQLHAARVALLSAASAAFWFAMILAVGTSIGRNLDELQYWLGRYSTGVWIALGLALVVWAARWLYRPQKKSD
jgi:membrane protein DedA with SNARE-associated domain